MDYVINTRSSAPFAVNVAGLPHAYPNLYLLEVLTRHAYNTQLKAMREILAFERFLDCKKISVFHRLRAALPPLDPSELIDLKNYLSFSSESRKAYIQGRLFLGTTRHKKFSKVVLQKGSEQLMQRSRAEQYASWRQISCYLDFLASKVRREIPLKVIQSYDNQLASFQKSLSNTIPPARNIQTKYQVKALPPDQFMAVVKELIQRDPADLFKTKSNRPSTSAQRDRLYLLCLAMTGGRPSEVMNLRLRDFRSDGEHYYVEFKDSRDNKQFSREEVAPGKRARNKSVGRHNRVVPVPKALFDLREQYLNGFYRIAIAAAISKSGCNLSKGFLFVKESGAPLGSRDYPSTLFSSIKEHFLVLLDRSSSELTAVGATHDFIPYTFRHSRATLYLFEAFEYAESKGEKFDLQMVLSNLRSFGGWSLTSDMPEHYGSLFTEWRQDGMNANFAKKIDAFFAHRPDLT
ncbi:site-specific integrase [Zhongshania aliphaticivorans]|uniref:site-specific integrase n=1 Tax=Zhongshania aliphaticivorans TaxID=1470434 RepID=UPI0012E64D42|nr:site-specific integrase [Zhongshania aliphaticivorans]CAA0118851.1 Uncharacterised protein [Zhongshania aliphaticivorans]